MTPKVGDRAVLRLSGLLLERVGLRAEAMHRYAFEFSGG